VPPVKVSLPAPPTTVAAFVPTVALRTPVKLVASKVVPCAEAVSVDTVKFLDPVTLIVCALVAVANVSVEMVAGEEVATPRLTVSKFVKLRAPAVCDDPRVRFKTSADASVVSARVLAPMSLLSVTLEPVAKVKLCVPVVFKFKALNATFERSADAVSAVASIVSLDPPDKVFVTVLPPKSVASAADLIVSEVLPVTVSALLPTAAEYVTVFAEEPLLVKANEPAVALLDTVNAWPPVSFRVVAEEARLRVSMPEPTCTLVAAPTLFNVAVEFPSCELLTTIVPFVVLAAS